MNDDQQSSLELLLDTITNTFGGILFLAILVVVLLQMSNTRNVDQPPSPDSMVELAKAKADIAAVIRQRDELRRAFAVQQRLRGHFREQFSREDLDAIKQLRKHAAELNTDRLDLTKQLVETQEVINRLAEEVEDLNQRLKIKRRDVQETEQEMKREVAARTTTAKLPRLHDTKKIEVAVVLKYGRIYFVHRCETSPLDRRVNTHDMVVVELDDDKVVVTPKPYAGIEITRKPGWDVALRKRLEHLPPDRVYLAIAVWQDSFDKFIEFKNVLVDMGHEYRIVPVLRGGTVAEIKTDSPPLVQ